MDTVGDKVWKEHYYDCSYAREKPGSSTLVWQVVHDEGTPRLNVRQAAQYASSKVDFYGFCDKKIGVYLYIYFESGYYDDTYLTCFVRFGADMDRSDQEAEIQKTKIHAAKDGTVTVTLPDGREVTEKLPPPDPDRCFRVTISSQMDAGWPVSFGDD